MPDPCTDRTATTVAEQRPQPSTPPPVHHSVPYEVWLRIEQIMAKSVDILRKLD